jgi:predicted MPP superfamily phosphohydrolase
LLTAGRAAGRPTLLSCPSLLFWIALIATVGGTSAGATDLEGALSGHLPAGTYRIVDDIYVPSGETLTLAPGVVFQFEDSFWGEYEFDVHGILDAQGTASDPITFQAAPGTSEYNYIRITSSASTMRRCVVEHAGKVAALNEGGLWIDDCSPEIDRCTIRDCYWHGIYITGASARPTITHTTSTGNDGDGIDGAFGAGMTVINCMVTGNAGDGICIASGANVLAGCLIAGNAEDGVDSHGLTDYGATLINCTIAGNGSKNLCDASAMDLYNTIAVGASDPVDDFHHSTMVSDPSYYHFTNYAGGDYRLTGDSPCLNMGTRFGPPADWLPDVDLDGNPRVNGIVDMGAYESTLPPDPGEEGPYFSPALLCPRMTQPVIRASGEEFLARVGLLGEFSIEEISAHLVDPLGDVHALEVRGLAARELTPGSELDLLLYAPGLEMIQEITIGIPADTPADFYDIHIIVEPYQFHSIHAVRILESYPPEWRFIHITDPHIGYDDEEYTAAERYRVFAREANFLRPDFIIITGDICENQNLDTGAYVDSMLAVTALLRAPVFVQPGNHDYYNDGDYNPYYPLRYFHRINRFRNAHFRFGGAHFLACDSGHDLGLLQLWRCRGPSDAALDWMAAILTELDPSAERPRFLLMHGPNYDYFTWNSQNVERVRDLMDAHSISLCLCGHTHRFETFLNEGENYFGRNDFEHEDDWEQDVPFPGYPLHVQTSSLGKEEQLTIPERLPGPGRRYAPEEPPLSWAEPVADVASQARRRGIFGDDIGWRYIAVADGEVLFFTADTDGDGYRNTEDPWMLGSLRFSVEHQEEGVIVSTVDNDHYETWTDVRHFIPADPEITYDATGGIIIRRHPDGTVEVAVDAVDAVSSSVVVLSPVSAGVAEKQDRPAPELAIISLGNPFSHHVTLRVTWSNTEAPKLVIFDTQGRRVRDLSQTVISVGTCGEATLTWDGHDEQHRRVPPGVYFIRLSDGERQAVLREVRIS